jgi:hypothetical protein
VQRSHQVFSSLHCESHQIERSSFVQHLASLTFGLCWNWSHIRETSRRSFALHIVFPILHTKPYEAWYSRTLTNPL